MLNRFNSGRIDYADLTEWSFLDKFFGFLLAHGFLEWAEGTYPNPRQRKNIPLWFLLAVMMQLSSSSDYFLFAGSHLGPGNESGLKEGERLVDDFCRSVGQGVIKLLIVDREYIDGAMISRFKRKHGIDVLVPLKKNMDAFLDAMGLAKLPEARWRLYREERESKNGELVKQEVMGVGEITSWEGCDVPLYVVLVKETKGGNEMIWALVSTRRFRTPEQAREHYELRMQVEERIDQLKNCWLIGKFTSPNFSLDMAQVVFTVLVYSLLQMYLMRKEMKQLAHKTIETLQQEERLGKNAVLVYARGHFGIFDLDEFMDMTLSIEGEPKERLHRWVKKFRAEKIRAP